MTLRDALEPMLRADPLRWRGLPRATVADLDALLGAPEESGEAILGFYPAVRRRYGSASGAENAGRGLVAWARTGVMVESAAQPPASVLGDLPEPSAVLAQEILVPDAYAYEYLYCATGLVLTVAKPLRGEAPSRIVRCRGLKPLASPAEFGPDYYRPFEDRVRWAEPVSGKECSR
jgi:hypothetical protein